AERSANDLCLTDRGGGPHAGQMLCMEAWFGPAGADVAQVERLAGEKRKSQARSQDLAAAFAKRAVQVDHGRTSCLATRFPSADQFFRHAFPIVVRKQRCRRGLLLLKLDSTSIYPIMLNVLPNWTTKLRNAR